MDPLVTSIPSANLCKVLHNFVDICIRKQNFAELTPVHLGCFETIDVRPRPGKTTPQGKFASPQIVSHLKGL